MAAKSKASNAAALLRLESLKSWPASSGGYMPQRRRPLNGWGRFQMAVFAVIITIMVLDLKPPEQPHLCGPGASVADCSELRGELRVHRNCLDESSSPTAFHRRSNAAAYLDQLHAFIYGVASAVRDSVGREHASGSRTCLRLCSGVCIGGIGLPAVRAPCPGSSGR